MQPNNPGFTRQSLRSLGILLIAGIALGSAPATAAGSADETTMACDAPPIVRTTPAGIEYVRTPDACFDDVVFPGIDYEPRYVEVDGMRVHYVEAGPEDGDVVLMLHGEPTWSYLYRDMIDGFADAGYRAIAMDPITEAEEAGYNAPFPRREYMALARYWPSMALEVGGVNEEAWAGLQAFERSFLTLYTPNDVGVIGEPRTYQPYIDSVPGAAGQPHGTVSEASHFLQDDQGYALVERIIEFLDFNG